MSVSVSIVSHGHDLQVRHILALLLLTARGDIRRVWLTLNVQEHALLIWLEGFQQSLREAGQPFELQVIRNASPAGFGANHNRSFAGEEEQEDSAEWFCVMNPDISWAQSPFSEGLGVSVALDVACLYPRQVDSSGGLQDYKRQVPTPGALIRRRLLGLDRLKGPAEWVCGAFMVLRSQALRSVGGFDTTYHMYCEDVDLCLRLQLAGGRLQELSEVCVVHPAHRRSLSNVRHFWWHLRSLVHLWGSEPYRRFLIRRSAHV